ncbi:MAG: hypothetical protein EXS67_03130 [Candidatus Margulisbacteria bacterium]|nr:hypothetical protein [Candidatus Margulisiibacteriota bacterium]
MRSESESEITFIDCFYIFWKRKILILMTIAIGISTALYYNTITSKIFLINATFFLPLQGSHIGGYAALLGADSAPDFGNYVIALVESRRIQSAVLEDVMPMLPKGMTKEKAIKELNMKNAIAIKKDKNSLFSITYECKDPKLGIVIVEKYLQEISRFNEELQLSENKKIVTILDAPIMPKKPLKPKKLLNIVIASILFSFFGVGLALITEGVATFREFLKTKSGKK